MPPRKRQPRAPNSRRAAHNRAQNGPGEIIGNSGRISDKRLANLRPFPKGVSGNPDGRPRGTREFAELIAGETRGGKELVEFALRVFRGEEEFRSEDRWSAMRW